MEFKVKNATGKGVVELEMDEGPFENTVGIYGEDGEVIFAEFGEAGITVFDGLPVSDYPELADCEDGFGRLRVFNACGEELLSKREWEAAAPKKTKK